MKFYVNSASGADNLTSSVFKTLNFALSCANDSSDTVIDIYLDNGNYEFNTTLNALYTSKKTVSIIGNGITTVLTQMQGFYSNTGGGALTFTFNISKLIYNTSATVMSNWNFFKFNWNFNNVVFKDIANESIAIFIPSGSKLSIKNCVKISNSTAFLRTDNGTISVNNSYGCFLSGYSTLQSSWDGGTNVITGVSVGANLIDSQYKLLTSNNQLYGVHSGAYFWSIIKYLIQNETNDLFTINNGLVNLATQTATESLYTTSGFSDITLLNGTTFNQTKTMVDEGVVGTGRMFSVEIDTSMVKNINIT